MQVTRSTFDDVMVPNYKFAQMVPVRGDAGSYTRLTLPTP